MKLETKNAYKKETNIFIIFSKLKKYNLTIEELALIFNKKFVHRSVGQATKGILVEIEERKFLGCYLK